jgi:hypothetical protein
MSSDSCASVASSSASAAAAASLAPFQHIYNNYGMNVATTATTATNAAQHTALPINMSRYATHAPDAFLSQANKFRTNAASTFADDILKVPPGLAAKTRLIKHQQQQQQRATIVDVNLHKTCPGCFKLWRMCQCSNVKNRPAPKPYSKFIPPRMQKKIVDGGLQTKFSSSSSSSKNKNNNNNNSSGVEY